MVSPGAGEAGRGGESPLEPGGSAGIGACHFVQRLGGAGRRVLRRVSRAFPDLALPRTFKAVSELTLSSLRKGSVASLRVKQMVRPERAREPISCLG